MEVVQKYEKVHMMELNTKTEWTLALFGMVVSIIYKSLRQPVADKGGGV